MAEEAKPIRELFNLGKKRYFPFYFMHNVDISSSGPSHYGPVPTKANPYLHVCLITKTYIREVFEKKLTRCIACPVTIKLKGMSDSKQPIDFYCSTLPGKYQDISEALSGLPPSVSSTELTQRFKVDVLKDVSIPLTSFFKPALHLLEGNELTNLINELHKDIVFMCTMATQHHMDAANNSQSNHMVSCC